VPTTAPLCEVCSCRHAERVLLKRRGDTAVRTYMCLECSSEHSGYCGPSGVNLSRMLQGMGRRGETAKLSAFACPSCGTTLADIVTDGRPGCCECYDKFASDIEDSILKAQEHLAHVGKSPY